MVNVQLLFWEFTHIHIKHFPVIAIQIFHTALQHKSKVFCLGIFIAMRLLLLFS